uniref:Uncharacterized protein n=1 Tax=Micrurus lemniscatus lemniscatus TaxID=129467 RepID=A0A2D4JN89_MICLE
MATKQDGGSLVRQKTIFTQNNGWWHHEKELRSALAGSCKGLFWCPTDLHAAFLFGLAFALSTQEDNNSQKTQNACKDQTTNAERLPIINKGVVFIFGVTCLQNREPNQQTKEDIHGDGFHLGIE